MKHSLQNNYLPLYLSKIAAGFPSPAEDYLAKNLNLHEHLVKHPAATLFIRGIGHDRPDVGIKENDLLIIDRSLTPSPGKLMIISEDGQWIIKRFPSTFFNAEEHEIQILGVMTYIIRSV